MLRKILNIKSLIIPCVIFLCFFISASVYSQSLIHVSGVVTNIVDGTPIANQQMYILIVDSNTINHENIYTDINGYYEDTIYTNLNKGILLVYTYDCNNATESHLISFSGNSNLTSNFSICELEHKSCQANFYSVHDTTIGSYNVYQFYDISTSSGTIISWYWTFGDGLTSTAQNPQHIFVQSGTYSVSLTINTDDLCQSIFSDSIVVPNQGVQTCNANFNYYKDPTTTRAYYFYDNSIFSGTIISWYWIFGDGDTSTTSNPYHQYSTPGIYQVCLGIVTSDICISHFCDTIYVDTALNACQANFNAVHDTSTALQNNYKFYDNSSCLSSSVIVSQFWSFGDGDTSTLKNPVHKFPYPSIYKVSLTITTSDGCNSTITKSITVGSPKHYTFCGQVLSGTYPPIDTGIAYLYKIYNNNYIIPVDTMAFGKWACYYFIDKIEGNYKIKIALHPSSTFYNQNAPTYYSDKLFWNKASNLILNSHKSNIDVHLINTNNNIGQGSISGNVIQTNKQTLLLGNSVSDILILLLDLSDNPITYTYTDSNGYYSFNNIGFGTYKVYAEATGFTTDPVLITISSTNLNVTGVTLTIKNTTIIGIADNKINTKSSIGKIYPNPVINNLNIEFKIASTTEFTISVINVVGQKVIIENIKLSGGNHFVKLPLNTLQEGIYFLNIVSKDRKISETRKFIK